MVYVVDCFDGVFLELWKYLLKYYGIWLFFIVLNDLYLKLEDVIYKFNKFCIMDVKIG